MYEYALERVGRLGYVRFANLVYGTLPNVFRIDWSED